MKTIAIGLILLIVVAGCQTTTAPAVENTPEPAATTAVSIPTEAPPEPAAATAVSTPTEAPPTAEPIAQATDEPPTTTAANADVVYVKAEETAVNIWTFAVSVDHPDTGWEDYADGWDVLLPDGTILKSADSPFTRLLAHPHEGQRPFTRSQANIAIPADVTTLTVRAHDLVDGFGGREIVVELTAVSGDGFEVQWLNP